MEEGELGEEIGRDIGGDDGRVVADEAAELGDGEVGMTAEEVEDGIELHQRGEWRGRIESEEEAPVPDAREEGRELRTTRGCGEVVADSLANQHERAQEMVQKQKALTMQCVQMMRQLVCRSMLP